MVARSEGPRLTVDPVTAAKVLLPAAMAAPAWPIAMVVSAWASMKLTLWCYFRKGCNVSACAAMNEIAGTPSLVAQALCLASLSHSKYAASCLPQFNIPGVDSCENVQLDMLI